MDLSELAAYAKEKYNIAEEHKWTDFPGFSVLINPETGKWAALLMRQWDSDRGEEIQRCDIKCGRDCLSGRHPSYLGMPFRMKGENWVGVVMGDDTDEAVVMRLLDAAMRFGTKRGYTIVLEGKPVSAAEVFKDTQLPLSRGYGREAGRGGQSGVQRAAGGGGQSGVQRAAGRGGQSTAQGDVQSPGRIGHQMVLHTVPYPAEYASNMPPLDDGFGLTAPRIPEKILQMRKLYEYGDGSLKQKCINFCRQGRFMADYEDDMPWKGDFRRYFPTYHDMNLPQLRGYFTWRTHLRRGEFLPIGPSFAYVYIYELLAGIGTDGPEDALVKMKTFEERFLMAGCGDADMKTNLRRWMLEFAIVKDVPPEIARQYADPALMEADASLAILKEPSACTDEEVFGALNSCGGNKLTASPVVTAFGDRGRRLFALLWRHLMDGESGFFETCFGQKRESVWYPLSNAVYLEETPHPDTVYRLNPNREYICRDGEWHTERYSKLYFNQDLLQQLLHEADRAFRKYLKTGHYLKEKPSEEWASSYAAWAIEADRRAEQEAARPVITIDFSDLAKIRQDADITRDSLLVEEEPEFEPKQSVLPETGTDVSASALMGAGVDESASVPVGLGADAIAAAAPAADTDRTEASKAGEAADVSAAGPAADAARTEASKAGDGAEASAAGSAADAARGAAPTGDAGIPELGLDWLHASILRLLLEGESPADLIRSHYLMATVAADTINEALFDEIGDTVVSCDGDEISLVEDYRDDLADLLGEIGL